MTFTLTPIPVKKSDGTDTPMIAYNDGTNNAFASAQLDATGAIISPATSGLQTTANSALASIATNTTNSATSAKQDTGNTALASIATNTGDVDTTLGARADAAASSDTGTFSLIALFKRLLSTSTTMSTAHGAPADAAVTNPASSASIIAALKGILTGVNAATPAGTNLMGKVGIDQTTPGTTNGVQVTAALPAGTNLIGKAGIDQTTPGTTNGVVINTGSAALPAPVPVIVTGNTTTRPADTNIYAAGDLLATSTTAATVNAAPTTAQVAKANDQAFQIVRCRLTKSGNALTNAAFRLHLYNSAPTVTNGDNGVWVSTGTANYLGSMDVTLTYAFSDGAFGIGFPTSGPVIIAAPATCTRNIYYQIEVRAAYTPTSAEVYTPYFEVL